MATTPSVSFADALVEDITPRQRAKERLYVICQLGGWFGLLAVQVFYVGMFGKHGLLKNLSAVYAALSQTIFLGLLVTHYGRRWLHRWRWKDLGWRKLAPRVVGFAVLLAVIWCVLGYGIYYGLLRMSWDHPMPWFAVFMTSCLNGTLLLTAWLCIYFFYHLFDRFNRLEVEGLRLTANVKEAELRALKSQINPHFIFNSLNSLRALIDENPARARQAVTQLANLLRYSLQSAQSETVAFENELRVVNDYLALEQVRHEERLRVRFDIEPDTLGLAVPPLLLQTLVENAVKYGISTRPDGGEIRISARCEAGQLLLRVTNPGELPSTPSRPGSSERSSRDGSTGLGLRNAAERLQAFFGERAQLQLRAEHEVVIAEVLIPMLAPRA